MAEYIDKQTAIAEIEELNIVSFYELNKHSREAYQEIKLAISSLPAADVRPVVRGRWEKIAGKVFPYWRCTACQEVHFLEPPNAKFCPGCGADMRTGGDAE